MVSILWSEAEMTQQSSTSARFLHLRILNRREEDRRVKKKRSVSIFQENQWFSLQLTLYNNSKSGLLTQPGWGIRKVVDLFHDLINLLGKADKHAAETDLDPAELEEINTIDFLGLTEEEIDDERKEWVDLMSDNLVTASVDNIAAVNSATLPFSAQLLNTLIPGFREKVDSAENFDNFLAPVGLSICVF